MKLQRYFGGLLILLGIACTASSSWYLIDAKECTAHARLCVSAQGGVAYTLFALSMGTASITTGAAMIYEALTGQRKRPRLYPALFCAGMGGGQAAFAIASLIAPSRAIPPDVAKPSDLWALLFMGMMCLTAALKLFQYRPEKEAKR